MQIKAVAVRRMRKEEGLKGDGMRGLDLFKKRQKKKERGREKAECECVCSEGEKWISKIYNVELSRVIAEAECVLTFATYGIM